MFAIAALAVNAQVANTDISGYNEVLYAEPYSTAQVGSTATIDIYAKNSATLRNMQFNVELPTGVRVTAVKTDLPGYSAASNLTATPQAFMISSSSAATVSAGVTKVATLTIDVPSTVALNDYPVSIVWQKHTYSGISDVLIETPVVSTLTVQRTMVLKDMDMANNIEIIPFSMSAGDSETEVQLLMTNENNIGNVEFDIYFPEGISFSLDGEDPMEAELDNYNSAPNQSIEENPDGSYHVQFYRSASKYYFNADLKADPIATFYFDAEAGITPGVHNVFLKNIVIDEKTDGGSYTGDYGFSIFVGKETTDLDPIVYGHYATAESQEALEDCVVGCRSVDASVATLFDPFGYKNTDQIIYFDMMGTPATAYVRTAPKGTNYATTCLPFALDNEDDNTYYTVSAVSSTAITLTETNTVEANTPCIVKLYNDDEIDNAAFSAIVVGDAPSYIPEVGEEVVAGALTFKGTYDSMTLTEGYVISGDKFWEVASANVKPFRGYFEGSLGVKSLKIQIEDATGIHDITDELSNEDIYNLQGIKLNRVQKGINIVGGKKVLVRK